MFYISQNHLIRKRQVTWDVHSLASRWNPSKDKWPFVWCKPRAFSLIKYQEC